MYLVHKSWFPNAILHYKEPGILKRIWLIPKLGQGKYKMSLEHLDGPECKEWLKE